MNNLLGQLPGGVWATDVNRCQFEAPIPGRPFPLYMYERDPTARFSRSLDRCPWSHSRRELH